MCGANDVVNEGVRDGVVETDELDSVSPIPSDELAGKLEDDETCANGLELMASDVVGSG